MSATCPELDQPGRLNEIAELGLDREQSRPWLSDLVEVVAVELEAEIALATILLDRAQAFAAGHGLPGWLTEAGGTPIEWSFCTAMLGQRSICVINDLTADPAGQDNPLVTVAGVRAYIGAPLMSPRGYVLGGLCALGLRPRQFTTDQVVFLQNMAAEASRRIRDNAPANVAGTSAHDGKSRAGQACS
ncbi:GAF domain-containing protein [Actinoplanes oblitus]|uniref:GAF domain-containing protein n=1 Tax=Actinoplanes oblitus TaxID=3040509 RepID=A0ABY8W6E1_9ACTN|nr:GAF domain-containing protein [Actinoplanes oblitus]WIM92592.1 GAF domain-containing protein [Actinoplanes oblitus]